MRLRLLLLGVLLAALPLASHGQSPGWGDEGWQRNGMAALRFDLQGTGNRNNPLRRRLAEPFSGDEFFVRYRLRYDAETIDTPTTGDGEFFVLWLDRSEGSDASTHSQGVPNVGLHVMEQQNRFMIRFDSGQQRFGPELQGDRDYLVVARLLKSVPGKAAA